jgi:hypothetical protein
MNSVEVEVQHRHELAVSASKLGMSDHHLLVAFDVIIVPEQMIAVPVRDLPAPPSKKNTRYSTGGAGSNTSEEKQHDEPQSSGSK